MLCSRCYKKIPEGEEVGRGSNGVYWQVGYWEGKEEISGGLFCVRCAKREERREKRFLMVFYCIFFIIVFIILIISFFVILKRR